MKENQEKNYAEEFEALLKDLQEKRRKKEPGIHAGHRERMKERFLKEGLDHFQLHEVLELILFLSIPRRDVNALAHELIQRFGSFSAVLDAPYEQLLDVPGIGKESALVLKMMPQIAKVYFRDRVGKPPKKLEYDALGESLTLHYIGLDHEEVIALFYNNAMAMTGKTVLHKGDINSASFSLRKLVDACVNYKASFVVLAHNHPHGLPIASGDDLHTNDIIRRFLGNMNIDLLDHFIIAENRFASIDKLRFQRHIKEYYEMQDPERNQNR